MDSFKDIIEKLTQGGLPIFFIRDPKTEAPSVTLTMLAVSFTSAVLAQSAKVSLFLGGIDSENANYLFGMCAALYFGRKITKSGKNVEIAEKQVDKS